MKTNSLILDVIRKNPDNWTTKIWAKYRGQIKIGLEESEGLAIFNYSIKADFSDPLVREARGIVIDYVNMKVVCWPFTKFGKYDEPYAADIDWSTAVLQEKIDGCIIKMWRDEARGEWRISSNSCIDAKKAYVNQEQTRSIYDICRSASNFNDIPFGVLDKDKTYIFELVSPELPSVVKANRTILWHIGTRSNSTGEEFNDYIFIRKPRGNRVRSLEEAVGLAAELNLLEGDGVIRHVDDEGFVAVDANFNRIKVKSPVYMTIHNIRQASQFSRKTLIDLIWDGRIDVQSICGDYPDIAHIIKWYDYKVAEVKNRAAAYIGICRKIYSLLGGDKRKTYERVKDHKFVVLFNDAVNNPDKSAQEILERIVSVKKGWLLDVIGIYPSENLSYMFDRIREDMPNSGTE